MAANVSKSDLEFDLNDQEADHAEQLRKREEALVADPSLGIPKIHNNGIYARANRHYYDIDGGFSEDPKDVEKEKQTKAMQFRQNYMAMCETITQTALPPAPPPPVIYQSWEDMVEQEPHKFVDTGLTCSITDSYYKELYGQDKPGSQQTGYYDLGAQDKIIDEAMSVNGIDKIVADVTGASSPSTSTDLLSQFQRSSHLGPTKEAAAALEAKKAAEQSPKDVISENAASVTADTTNTLTTDPLAKINTPLSPFADSPLNIQSSPSL